MTVRGGLGRGLGALLPPAPSTPRERTDVRGDVPPPRVGDDDDGRQDPQAYVVSQRPPVTASRADAQPNLPPQADQTTAAASSGYFTELPITLVRPNPRQPRSVFDEDALTELAESVALVGLLQPIVVRPAADGGFELVMGERRWRAAQLAGLDYVPAIVRQTRDADLLRDALLENLHRAELNPLEEAAAYSQLLEDFGVTHEELAERIGRSRPHITNTLRLLRLTPPVQRRVAAGVLSAGHARALVAVTDPERQDRLATQAVAQGLSVRTLEELVATDDLPAGTTRTRHASRARPELDAIADRLSERFDTRCRVELGKRKGKVILEFATVSDLHRILAAMGVPE